MSWNLHETHDFYRVPAVVAGEEIISLMRRTLGDTNYLDSYQSRKWVTSPSGGVFVRKDISPPPTLTFYLLKNEIF